MDTRTSGVAWLALVVAILALLLAWIAFNRTSEINLGGEIRRQTERTTENVQLAMARFEAKTRLSTLAANQELSQNSSEFEMQLESIRSDLRNAYRNASSSQAEWDSIDAQFNELEAQVRAGTADALQTLRNLIGSLESDVRYDDR